MNKTSSKYSVLLIYLALALATIAVYWQVHSYEFVNYDDPQYVLKNQNVKAGLSCGSIIWAFTTGHAGNWHPLTWLSHMLDCHLFGLEPGWHHLTGLLLHLANTLLLFAVIKRMTHAIWQSAFVAAAFALHPLHVESVAWIAERKDVLSTLFWLLTMLAYLRYVERPGKSWYLLALLAFALGLMAKPMLVTLPFVLLLLDYWPLGRFQGRRHAATIYRLIGEKAPLFALAAVSSVITFFVQRSGGAVIRIEQIPAISRIANAFNSYIIYITKMLWPSRLAVFYPHPVETPPLFQPIAAALLLLVISILVIRSARNHRYLLTGWLWFIGTLVPVIGLVQVGDQALADRYTYIPLTGLFIIIAWALPDILAKWRYRKIILGASALIVLSALSVCTRLQVRHWRSSITLFEHALEVTEDNYEAHFCIAEPLRRQGKNDEAIAHNSEALRIKPDYIEAHNGLGIALIEAGRPDEAVTHFTRALQLNPDCIEAKANLGVAFACQGRLDQAVTHFKEVIRTNPGYADAYSNLGYALTQQGKLEEAAEQYKQALRTLPDNPVLHNELGVVLARQGKLDEAIKHYVESLRIKPDYAEAQNDLGNALLQQGKLGQAVTYFTEALRIEPDFAKAHHNLGNALFQQGKIDQAINHFIEALRISPDFAEAHNDLAVALANKGRLDEAIAHVREALRIKPDFVKAQANLSVMLARQKKLDR